MAKIKAIFFDIDGTLVPFGDHRPPQEVIDALRLLRERGIRIFIATGRHPVWIDNLGELQVDGYVTVNGNLCVEADRKTVIFKHCIPADDIDRVIDFSHHSDIPIVAVPVSAPIIINRENHIVEEMKKLINMPSVPIRDLSAVQGEEIVQLMAFAPEEEREASGLFKDVILGCEPTSWTPQFCDIIPRGSDKSVGISHMIAAFGIRQEETMAFGDGGNDIGMLRYAGIGIAMGNASPEVKAAADYVTSDVDHAGVINALRRFDSMFI